MRSLFKNYFVAGALVLVPVVLTVWILKGLIAWCDELFSVFGFQLPGAGFVLTIALIFLTGILTRLYLGRKLIALGERILHTIPFGNNIYRVIKQFLNAVVAGGEATPRQVVLVEYPRKGSYMIGFVTGESAQVLEKKLGQKMVHIFIPTTPNPTSGFLILAPRENILPIDIPADQAFKLIISGGTVTS